MSNLEHIRNVSIGGVRGLESPQPAWIVVLKRELADLWIGGKGLILILVYSILLGAMAYISWYNAVLDMLPSQEAVSDLLWNAMTVSTFLGLIVGADTLSGERDRATLESLLLIPASRSHIVLAKLLAGISIWPVAYVVAIPYVVALAESKNILGSALFWGAITGSILIIGYTGMGMLISFWSGSNKLSYFVSLGIYALLLIPAELPGDTVEFVGRFMQWINPMAATNHFLSNQLDQGTSNEFTSWLLSSLALAVLSVGLLLSYVSKGLRLEAGTNIRFWDKLRRAIGLLMIAGLTAASLLVSPVYAFQGNQAEGYAISINADYHQVKVGEKIEVGTAITNYTSQSSPPLVVAMNVINLDDAGAVVDPEDWSPERTQYIESLESGQSASLDWIINPIMEGNFVVYMVLIPEAASADTTIQLVASPSIHLTVAPFTGLSSINILPIVIAEPIILLAITYFVYRRRRQQVDLGGPS
jgi:ABC-type transport system involved in cytochrome c biogenesis permease component